ncbi:MAG: hypothetical protein R3F43_18180 [bacterium]
MAAYALTRDDRQSRAKVKTARYYMHNIPPETKSLIAIATACRQAQMMDFDVDELPRIGQRAAAPASSGRTPPPGASPCASPPPRPRPARLR